MDNEFVPIEKVSGAVPDIDYVDGAIELSINDVCIIDRSMWDLVDQLWAYIVNGLDEISQGKPHVCYFPDQPIEMKFQPVGDDRVLFSVLVHEPVSVIVDRQCFIKAMIKEAEAFFVVMTRLAELSGCGGIYDAVVSKIKRVEKCVL